MELTIKSSNNFITFFFINKDYNKENVYEYYIYLPICNHKNYIIYNFSLNYNKPEKEKERLNSLFIVKTNKYYFEIQNAPDEFGYFILNNMNVTGKTLISNNDYILDFIRTNKEITNYTTILINYTLSVEDEEAYSKKCQITLNLITCYKSCETCSIDINNSNETKHNCIKCMDDYYHSPENNSNCYSLEEKNINWYLDSNNSRFGFCHKNCKSCSGPSKFNCTSCNNGFYLDNGNCTNECSPGFFIMRVQTNQNDYFICRKCDEKCNTCYNFGNYSGMNCETCKENYIKYNDNCYEIIDASKKLFLISEGIGRVSSCFEMFSLYIKEDSNECINSSYLEGYYISNNKSGLLSKCHDNCLTCYQGPIKDNLGNIISMECLKCKDSNNSSKTMIKMNNNCFKIIQYEETKIVFNISEINQNIEIGTCKYFGKVIYYGEYTCIDKPISAYYVLNGDENTGVIKDYSEYSDTLFSNKIIEPDIIFGNSNNDIPLEEFEIYNEIGEEFIEEEEVEKFPKKEFPKHKNLFKIDEFLKKGKFLKLIRFLELKKTNQEKKNFLETKMTDEINIYYNK